MRAIATEIKPASILIIATLAHRSRSRSTATRNPKTLSQIREIRTRWFLV